MVYSYLVQVDYLITLNYHKHFLNNSSVLPESQFFGLHSTATWSTDYHIKQGNANLNCVKAPVSGLCLNTVSRQVWCSLSSMNSEGKASEERNAYPSGCLSLNCFATLKPSTTRFSPPSAAALRQWNTCSLEWENSSFWGIDVYLWWVSIGRNTNKESASAWQCEWVPSLVDGYLSHYLIGISLKRIVIVPLSWVFQKAITYYI